MKISKALRNKSFSEKKRIYSGELPNGLKVLLVKQRIDKNGEAASKLKQNPPNIRSHR